MAANKRRLTSVGSIPAGRVYTPLSAPQNLTATAGDAHVQLAWQAPASQGGSPVVAYVLYRCTHGNPFALLRRVDNTFFSYIDTPVTNGTTYYYTVTAENSEKAGPASNEVWAMPASIPTAPQSVTATPGDGQVVLSWEAPVWNVGAPVTNYNVYRGTASNRLTLLATLGNILSHTDTPLTNGWTYYYQVTAANATGEGPHSSVVAAQPAPPPPPSAPLRLKAAASDAHVTLTWDRPTSEGGSPITNYNIYRGTARNNMSRLTTSGNALSHTDISVTNNTKYYYQVRAENAGGEGPESNQVSARPARPLLEWLFETVSQFVSRWSKPLSFILLALALLVVAYVVYRALGLKTEAEQSSLPTVVVTVLPSPSAIRQPSTSTTASSPTATGVAITGGLTGTPAPAFPPFHGPGPRPTP